MAKGKHFQNCQHLVDKNRLKMEDISERTRDSMDVDLDSLSLNVFQQCRLSSGAMDICESGVEADDFRNTEHAQQRIGCVYDSIDEGYNSKSMPDKHPVQETENNNHVTPMPSLDVLSVFSQDKDGDTELHTAIIQRQTSPAMLFISSAPNSEWLNIPNMLLQTPLHLAVITKQEDIVRRLMVAGARVDTSDCNGNTPLHIACREGHVPSVQCLLRPVFYEETHLNNYDIPYQRIPQDLNRRNSDGHACLHLAAVSTHLKVLELLLSKAADINVRDGTSGRTVLHYAAETGNRILLNFLLCQRRVNISCRTFGGLTPLRLAAGRGYGDVVNVLLANGADVADIDDSEEEAINDFRINGQPVTWS